MKKLTVVLALALTLFAGAAYAARAKGKIFGSTIAGSGSTTTATLSSWPGSTGVTIFVNLDQAGTVTILRVDADGTTHAQAAAATVTAGTEKIVTIAYPLRRFQVVLANTSTNTATGKIEVDDGLPFPGEIH